MKINVDDQDLGTICVCALRYAMGRETYMPSLVRDFVRPLLKDLPFKTIAVMFSDCENQARYENYGNETIDKPGWLAWSQEINAEMKRRDSLNANS